MSSSPRPEPLAPVLVLPSDGALVTALRRRNRRGAELLFDRYGDHLRRVLMRLLGADAELGDLLHDVFVAALDEVDSLEDPQRLKAWLTGIAVNVARVCIRKRAARRWLWFLPAEEVPEVPHQGIDPEGRELMRAVYEVLERFPADERIAFALRFIDGMELVDVAQACDVSLATIKRRLRRAEDRFHERAAAHPVLSSRAKGDVP